MYSRPVFPKIKSIYGEAAVSTAVGSITIFTDTTNGVNAPCRVQCTTGVMYLSTLSTAPLQANMWRLEEGESLDLYAREYISLMSTTLTASRQILVYEA